MVGGCWGVATGHDSFLPSIRAQREYGLRLSAARGSGPEHCGLRLSARGSGP